MYRELDNANVFRLSFPRTRESRRWSNRRGAENAKKSQRA